MARQKAETAGAAQKRTAKQAARGAAKTTRKTTAKSAAAGKTAAKTATNSAATRGAAKGATRGAAKSAAAKSGAARKIPTKRSPGISRVDQDSTRTHGWVVRLAYEQTSSGWRPKHTAYFGDATHGGAVKALAAAEEYLRKLQRSEKKAARAS